MGKQEYSAKIPENAHGRLESYNNFSVSANGLYPIASNTVKATVEDYGVVLTKVDSETKAVLEGAEFKLLT